MNAVSGTSKIASLPKTSIIGVVATTPAATSARERPISRVPSAAVKTTVAIAARALSASLAGDRVSETAAGACRSPTARECRGAALTRLRRRRVDDERGRERQPVGRDGVRAIPPGGREPDEGRCGGAGLHGHLD